MSIGDYLSLQARATDPTQELIETKTAMAVVSGYTGIDFSACDPNASASEVPLGPGVHRHMLRDHLNQTELGQ